MDIFFFKKKNTKYMSGNLINNIYMYMRAPVRVFVYAYVEASCESELIMFDTFMIFLEMWFFLFSVSWHSFY